MLVRLCQIGDRCSLPRSCTQLLRLLEMTWVVRSSLGSCVNLRHTVTKHEVAWSRPRRSMIVGSLGWIGPEPLRLERVSMSPR